jgi:uncharacterized protein YvpB
LNEPPTLDIPEITLSANDVLDPDIQNIPASFVIEDFPYISQKPELPTGCEVTSLAMVLSYLGFDVDKLTLADSYLPKGTTQDSSIYDAFIGNPRSSQSFGCYAPVLVKCASAYLQEQDRALKIYNYTNSRFEILLEQVAAGHPCIVWSTISLVEPYAAESWVVNGEICQWYAQEHCVVLIGYDLQKNQVTVADPLEGIRTRDLDLFETRYDQMFRQAICIY